MRKPLFVHEPCFLVRFDLATSIEPVLSEDPRRQKRATSKNPTFFTHHERFSSEIDCSVVLLHLLCWMADSTSYELTFLMLFVLENSGSHTLGRVFQWHTGKVIDLHSDLSMGYIVWGLIVKRRLLSQKFVSRLLSPQRGVDIHNGNSSIAAWPPGHRAKLRCDPVSVQSRKSTVRFTRPRMPVPAVTSDLVSVRSAN